MLIALLFCLYGLTAEGRRLRHRRRPKEADTMNGKFHFRRTGPIRRMIKRPRPVPGHGSWLLLI